MLARFRRLGEEVGHLVDPERLHLHDRGPGERSALGLRPEVLADPAGEHHRAVAGREHVDLFQRPGVQGRVDLVEAVQHRHDPPSTGDVLFSGQPPGSPIRQTEVVGKTAGHEISYGLGRRVP
ncbi:hypothetical protein [Actinoplanes sp. NPDC051411]|uniref:hypothetical protein n=1 Tax=Actinoplanes sp. NPDC051411 TaxID=3155522 RepID=UPI003440C0B5